jgi:phosphate transport system substrate-binding protein
MSCKLSLRALALAAALTASSASAETLRVSGTGGATAAMQHIALAFDAATGIKMEVIPSLGSSGAMRALAAGALDVVISARPLNPDEIAKGFVEILFARTALVFITSHAPPNDLKRGDLTRMFTSLDPKWADATPISIILRTKLDGDVLLLSSLIPEMRAAIDAARRRPDLPIAATDQDSIELAERLPGSLVQAGLSQVIMEKRKVHLVSLDGVAPSLENLKSGKYPYPKPFYLVLPLKKNAAAERLVDYLQSADGRAVLSRTGNLPAAN